MHLKLANSGTWGWGSSGLMLLPRRADLHTNSCSLNIFHTRSLEAAVPRVMKLQCHNSAMLRRHFSFLPEEEEALWSLCCPCSFSFGQSCIHKILLLNVQRGRNRGGSERRMRQQPLHTCEYDWCCCCFSDCQHSWGTLGGPALAMPLREMTDFVVAHCYFPTLSFEHFNITRVSYIFSVANESKIDFSITHIYFLFMFLLPLPSFFVFKNIQIHRNEAGEVSLIVLHSCLGIIFIAQGQWPFFIAYKPIQAKNNAWVRNMSEIGHHSTFHRLNQSVPEYAAHSDPIIPWS